MKYVFLLVLGMATTVVADGPSYTSMTAGFENGSGNICPVPFIPGTDALTFFNIEAEFDAACPGMVTEDFSSTLVPENNAWGAPGSIDYNTDNVLFALHSIVQGISIWEQTSADMVVLTPSIAGVTSVSIGPDLYADNAVFTFSASTNAFGAYIVMPMGGNINIEIFGASGSLGTTTTTGAAGDGTFWGVYCDSEDITSITFNGPDDSGELFANVKFGSVAVALSRTTWANVKACF